MPGIVCLAKLKKEITAFRKQGKAYKKIAKALNVPRDRFGRKVHKFKVKGTLYYLNAIKGEKQISEETGVGKPSSDCKTPAARLGGNRHCIEFAQYSK